MDNVPPFERQGCDMNHWQRARRRMRDILRGETTETFFDLHNPAEWQPLFRAFSEPFPCILNPTCTVRPLSLQRARRLYLVRRDLAEVFPFGLTPWQRGELLIWFLSHGQNDLELPTDEFLGFLLELDQRPDRGLVATYSVQPDWQRRHPDALTPHGWKPFKQFLKNKYKVRGRWFDTAALPGEFHASRLPVDAGVNLLGHFYYPSGLQEAADGIATALQGFGPTIVKRDLPIGFDGHRDDADPCVGFEPFDITVSVAAIDTNLAEWMPRSGLYPRGDVYRIAVWYWELSDIPKGMVDSIDLIHEIWAPTTFIADAIRKHVSLPVVPMLPGVALPKFQAKTRTEMGLPDGFLFLFTFDMNSRMPRKNPLGLIAAFRKAFAATENVHLVIKVSRIDKCPEHAQQLRQAATDSGVTLIEGTWPRADLLALLNCCDSYVSLHRSEGLGLGLAEAMLLGKPVIATNYSGNLDFMNATTARLVEYEETRIPEDVPPYPKGFIWAEPSLDHAAEELRWVADHPIEAQEMGQRAAEYARRILAPQAAGKRMMQRIDMIRSRVPHDPTPLATLACHAE